ncbi:MAG TPA: hypothetical protein PLD84_02740 [Chitinophagales bacterium]|nr:hypothetical protein [Chitinophagales bacterium]
MSFYTIAICRPGGCKMKAAIEMEIRTEEKWTIISDSLKDGEIII